MSNQLKITLTRSVIGGTESQRNTVKALGLQKMNQTVVTEDSPAIRGMVKKIDHLLTVKEL